MKTKHILVATWLFGLNAMADLSAEEYAGRLGELGSEVQNGSEAGGAIEVKIIPYVAELVDISQFNCEAAIKSLDRFEQGSDCLVVIRGNKRLALDTYFDEIAPGDENASVRTSMKSLLRDMDGLYLYNIGFREDGEDHEISGWYLVAEYKGKIILLMHERVYT